MRHGFRLQKPSSPRKHGNRWHRSIDPKQVRDLYATGLSTRQVARQLKISKSRVAKLCADITREKTPEERSKAAQKRQPQKSKHWRTSRANARRKYERAHGVKLPSDIHVHHKDEDFTNQDIDNLEAINAGEHSRLHHLKWVDENGNVIPRWKRPARAAYMKRYLSAYRKAHK